MTLRIAVATIIFDREDKRRIEAFQVIVALAMFFPLLVILGYLLSTTSLEGFGAKPIIEMSVRRSCFFSFQAPRFFPFFLIKDWSACFLEKAWQALPFDD